MKKPTIPSDLFSAPVSIKWREGAPAPVDCACHTAVWLNGLVYVGGGWQTSVKQSYTINCYDPVNNSWRPSINTPNCLFAFTTLNNKLLVAGGQEKSGKRTNLVLTTDGDQLKHYTKMITARSDATATGYQGMLIITGGCNDKGRKLSSTELFDSNDGQWHNCNDIPRPHVNLSSVIIDNILYLLGGNSEDGASPAVFTAPLNTLSKRKLKWNTHHDTPCHHSAPVSVCGTHLLIIGGGKKIGKNASTSDVYRLDKTNHRWKTTGHIPSPRNLSAAVSTDDNRIIVIGGQSDKLQLTNTVWIGSCERQSEV